MRSTLARAAWCFLLSLGIGALLSVSWWLIIDRRAEAKQELVIEIPAGTAEAVSQGAAPATLPAALKLRAASGVVVVNRDSVTHRLGNLTIPAGEQQSASTAVLLAASTDRFLCSFHPGGSIGLVPPEGRTPASALWSIPIIGLPLGVVTFGVASVLSRL